MFANNEKESEIKFIEKIEISRKVVGVWLNFYFIHKNIFFHLIDCVHNRKAIITASVSMLNVTEKLLEFEE